MTMFTFICCTSSELCFQYVPCPATYTSTKRRQALLVFIRFLGHFTCAKTRNKSSLERKNRYIEAQIYINKPGPRPNPNSISPDQGSGESRYEAGPMLSNPGTGLCRKIGKSPREVENKNAEPQPSNNKDQEQ